MALIVECSSDRACDVHPYVQRIGKEGSEVYFGVRHQIILILNCPKVCKNFAENIKWVVDRFHIKGHVEAKCKLSSPECIYHPDCEDKKDLFANMNTEVCKQSFRTLNMTRSTTRFLTVNTRLVFLKVQDDERNAR